MVQQQQLFLAQAMVHEGIKNLAAGANPIVLRKGMKKATDAAVEAIASMSSKVESKERIANVAAISAGDVEVGAMVADAMEKVSNDGDDYNRRIQDNADRAGSGRRYAV